MSSSTDKPMLAFGVEIELLVKPKGTMDASLSIHRWNSAIKFATKSDELKSANRKALRAALADVLTQFGVRTSTMTQDYHDWTVADEPTLDEFEGYCKSTAV